MGNRWDRGSRRPSRPSGLPLRLCVSTLPSVTTGSLQPLPLPLHTASIQSLPSLREPLPLLPTAGSISSFTPSCNITSSERTPLSPPPRHPLTPTAGPCSFPPRCGSPWNAWPSTVPAHVAT